MTRRCSHCSNNGHNSRTCPAARLAASAAANSNSGSGSGGVRLFGVRLTEGVGSMKKSASMGNLPSHFSSSSSPGNNTGSPSPDPTRDHDTTPSGYASDDPTHACSSSNRSERKKGTPWTEEEHRMFLFGLQKLGKGDWRGIARNFVVSRTPTQVASHAQKYFIRQTNASRRKRRSSLFDMVPEMQVDHLPALDEQVMPRSPPESENTNQLPSLRLGQDQETEPSDPSSNPPQELKECIPYGNIPLPPRLAPGPAFYPALLPMPYPFWPPAPTPPPKECTAETHEVLKPTPVLPKEPRNVDEVVGMSKLSIGEGKTSRMEPSALSLKMLEASTSRQSAFHVNPTITGADLSLSNSSPIHAL